MNDHGRILFAFLGNPGSRYENTRHNIGFMFADAVISNYGLNSFNYCKKFKAFISADHLLGTDVIFLKPDTYMNLSGQAITPATKAFSVTTENLFVVHDDMDIKFGDQKIKYGGGDAGHRGIRSVVFELGSQDFFRIRLGIGKSGSGKEARSHVLDKFLDEEISFIQNDWCSKWNNLIKILLSDGLEKAMSIYNKRRRG